MNKFSITAFFIVLSLAPLTFGQVIQPTLTRSQDGLEGLPVLDLSDATKARAHSTIHAEETERATRYDQSLRIPLFNYADPQKSGERFTYKRYDPSPGGNHLPVKDAELIVTGQVMTSTPHLTKGGTAVYSTFAVKVEDALKGASLLDGHKEIIAEREGGIVLYPSGRKRMEGILHRGLPEPTYRYLLFLHSTPTPGSYVIVTGYALLGDKVVPLDSADSSEASLSSTALLAQTHSQLAGTGN